MYIKSSSTILVIILGLILVPSCKDYAASESLRKEIKSIDWTVDKVIDYTHHGSDSCGGSKSNSSELSLAISFEAPKNYQLPEKTEEWIIEKIKAAISKAGGTIIRSGSVAAIHYTEHSDAFDESASMFKVVYRIDGTVGSITGVLNKRRHTEARDAEQEVIGQLLLSLDEER